MKPFSELTATVAHEAAQCLARVDEGEVGALIEALIGGNRIFLAGAGRGGLVIRAFAMRLTHLGRVVHVVGDATTPAIGKEDLLFICSGSGRTAGLLAMAQKATTVGAAVALVTIDRGSPIADLARWAMVIPAPSPKSTDNAGTIQTIQPMGSLFEQCALLTFDCLIMALMERSCMKSDAMFARHANLE